MYRNGKGVSQDDAEAVQWYRKAAEQGYAEAQSNLGWMYQKGKGVPQNDAEAVEWYRKAAEQGYAIAQHNLGWMYRTGKGVPQNDAEAVKWYRKAAVQGYAKAQNKLGWMYQNGKGVPQNDVEAVKWYRKAAEQGHAVARNNLAQMTTKGIKVDKAESEPLSEQRIAVTPSDSKNEKSSPVVRHLRDDRECKALLDACTPLLYVLNVFRISGVPVDASTRDVKRRIEDLRSAAEMGDLQNELIHAFALDPAPSLDQIREAGKRLQDSEQRIIDEFFWFWPNEWGKSDIDPAMIAFSKGDKGTLFKIWSEALSDNHSSRSIVAKHNLAVMYHLKALDSEQNALKNNLSDEQIFTISKDWRTCFKWWEELADDETLWSLVADRIRMVADQGLTTGFARRLRATLPEAICLINARLALSFTECGKESLVENHICYVKETHQGQGNLTKTLPVITAPHKTRVRSAVENAISTAERQPKDAARSARELLQAAAKDLQILKMILPTDDRERVDLCDTTAEACLKCLIIYSRETEDWETSVKILDEAEKLATSQETKTRLSENRNIFRNNRLFSQYIDPLTKRIEEIESRHIIAEKVSAVEVDVLPYLRTLERMPDMTAEAYRTCADLVARFVRELSVSAYNENKNLAESIRILNVAIATARGAETREQLQEDKAKLADIQTEANKYNLHMQIRSDNIEITQDFVRYNKQNILVSEVLGIKFGVFVQYMNGIKTNSSYLIDLMDGQGGYISIECKRIFRSDAQVEQDFNRILESIFHQVAPSLVQRLAESIIADQPLPMGDCLLTVDGMQIKTGSLWWKKEAMVPFSDLRFGTYQGNLTLSSAKDREITAALPLRDTWNAVFFEFIVKTIAQLKSERRAQASPTSRNT